MPFRLPSYGRQRLGRALAALALIVACAVVPAVFALVVLERETERQVQLLGEAFDEAGRIQTLRTLSERRAHYARALLLTGDIGAYYELQVARVDFEQAVEEALPQLPNARSRRLLLEAIRIHEAIGTRVDTLYLERRAGASVEFITEAFEDEVEPRRKQLDELLRRLDALVERELERAGQDIQQRRQVTVLILTVGVLGAAAISALSGGLLFRLLRDLAASERRFRDTFNQAAVGLAHVGLDGTWLRFNQRTCEILGYSRDALMGVHLKDITHPEDLEEDLENMKRLAAGELRTYSMDKRFVRPDGSVIWTTLTVSLAREQDAGDAYFISVLEDISHRKEVEAERERLVGQLKDAVRVREEFLCVASHELRTPLTPLALQLDSLRAALERSGVPERLVDKVRSARRQTRRLEGIVQNLLDVTELASGDLVLDRRPHDLAAIVREVVGRFLPDAARAGTPLALEAPGALEARVDRLRVEQLLSSLLSNALRYGAGAPVDVELGALGGEARIRVRDRGGGIEPEAIERIFQRFERAAPVEHYGGLGLGLFLARRIAEAHDGEIRAFSRPGEGALFEVRLPLIEAGSRLSPPAEA